jgi:hypothetical protein
VSALGPGSPPQYQERVQSDTGQKGLEAPVPNRQPQVLGQLLHSTLRSLVPQWQAEPSWLSSPRQHSTVTSVFPTNGAGVRKVGAAPCGPQRVVSSLPT